MRRSVIDRHLDIILLFIHVNSSIVLCRLFNDCINVICSNIITIGRDRHNRSGRAVANDNRIGTRIILSLVMEFLDNDIAAFFKRIDTRIDLTVTSPFNAHDRIVHKDGIRLEIDRIPIFDTCNFDFGPFIDIHNLNNNLLGRSQRIVFLIAYAYINRID